MDSLSGTRILGQGVELDAQFERMLAQAKAGLVTTLDQELLLGTCESHLPSQRSHADISDREER
jgi:hypothetical protein